MAKVMKSGSTRSWKTRKEANIHRSDDFTPCSQDMTICGDCEGNRAKKKCPRLKEWLTQKEE
jgi:hypothetical protein